MSQPDFRCLLMVMCSLSSYLPPSHSITLTFQSHKEGYGVPTGLSVPIRWTEPPGNGEEDGSRPRETTPAGMLSPESTAGEQGSSDPSSTKPHYMFANAEQKPSWQAIRLSNIPSTVQANQFIDIIKGVAQGSQFDKLPWSFFPDATTEYQERYNVATVTFTEVPPSISKGGVWNVRTEHGTLYGDEGFLGMTPLASPPQKDTTVE